ncbi:hypothetical protein K435DRAFT_611246, partial [Dendrothele bispora CBS 962.96]
FFNMQEDTGVVISGSSVLQFFTGCQWESDLDLYVLLTGCRSAGMFILSCNYRFVPRSDQDSDFTVAMDDVFISSVAIGAPSDYDAHGIVTVFNFKRGNKTIQLVACRSSIVEVILGFHSTCVMNLATRDYAISLFPFASLVSQVSLVNTAAEIDASKALTKYTERGWSMLAVPGCAEFLTVGSELGQNVRFPGD